MDDFYNSIENLQNKIKINIIVISYHKLNLSSLLELNTTRIEHSKVSSEIIAYTNHICIYATGNRNTGNDVKKTSFVHVWKLYLFLFSRRH